MNNYKRYPIGNYNPDGTPMGGKFAPKVETQTTYTRKTSGGNGNFGFILLSVCLTFVAAVTCTIALLEAKASREQAEALRNEVVGLRLADKLTEKEVKQLNEDLIWLTKAHVRDSELNSQLIENLQSRIILKR